MTISALSSWLQEQRWYAGGRTAATAHVRGQWELVRTDDVSVALALVHEATTGTTYVVPLATYSREQSGLAAGALVDSANGLWTYDATETPEGHRALLEAALCPTEVSGRGDATELTQESPGEPRDPASLEIVSSARLRGEQSNTSIRYELAGGEELIVKVFRVLQDGLNPDVVLQSELGRAGSTSVPAMLGWTGATWTTGSPATSGVGHVLVVQEFLAGARDAWQVITDSITDEPIDSELRGRLAELGALTRRIHEMLAQRLPTVEAKAEHQRALVASWRSRAAAATVSAPELAADQGLIESIFVAGAMGPWPELQRIHGDYHLGQVLDVPHRGWVVLDFEGEPLRPLAERNEPDVALRDVAGMLRSFDYAGADARKRGVSADATAAWTAEARAAFLEGYGDLPGDSAELLAALELDKALYEVSYEVAQRPDWVDVPLGGVAALLSAHRLGGATSEADAQTPSNDETIQGMNLSPVSVSTEVLAAVADARYHAPHDVLGPHLGDGGVTIRVVRHLAESVAIETASDSYEAEHEYGGIWVAVLPLDEVPDYRVSATYGEGITNVTDDPYRFLPTVGEMDTYLFNEGRHEELWKVLGAHVREYESVIEPVSGVSFSVWAPNARAVRVVGDFNFWNGTGTAMRSLGASGIWEIFVPGAALGSRYKFEIQYQDGSWHQKADPMARRTEIPPSTASIVTDTNYEWSDDAWMHDRASTDALAGPISVYEVHLGSWRQGLSFKEMAEQLIGHVTYLGFTHVELMPISEHPFGGSWGYQVSGYYAPTARFGSPDEFRYLVDELHKAGIGVIVDWVPAHFPKDEWALARFDGTPLYEDPDPLRGEQPDWGTYVFNYGRNEVRNFLVANALYWLEEFHIDGIRVDAVASLLYLDYSREAGQWRPNIYGGRENLEAISFLQETNATAYRRNPGILMIAEESTSWPGVTGMTDSGGLGFGLKWNMGWMNDTLHYLKEEPINRRYHHGEITFSLVYAFSEQFLLPISHDEVVHGKGSLYTRMPGDKWQKLAGLRCLFAYQWAHPGKQLIFMGQEFGQIAEWNEGKGLDWWLTEDPAHDATMGLVARLNSLYREHPALHSDDFSNHGFEWIEVSDGDHNVLSFVRKSADDKDIVVAIINFAGTAHENYRVGLPFGGTWEEILNTDAEEYGGSGVGNLGQVTAEDIGWNGRQHSVSLRVPPLGALYLTPKRD